MLALKSGNNIASVSQLKPLFNSAYALSMDATGAPSYLLFGTAHNIRLLESLRPAVLVALVRFSSQCWFACSHGIKLHHSACICPAL